LAAVSGPDNAFAIEAAYEGVAEVQMGITLLTDSGFASIVFEWGIFTRCWVPSRKWLKFRVV
jgi:hypothetical protein